MRAFFVRPVPRLLVAAAAAGLLVWAAVAARPGSVHAAGSRRAAAPGPASSPRPGPARPTPAALGPGVFAGRLSPARASAAAQTCAAHATAAGWADNGSYGGSLVTAVAVCVAESGGQADIYYCDATGQAGHYPPAACASGSYDRGLWQLNSQYQPQVSDACAFRAQCNADAAYLISANGVSFAPWAVYGGAGYAQYLQDAQTAVDSLSAGTVVGAVFGVCAARVAAAAGAAVIVGRCGRGSGAQQWQVRGDVIGRGGLCLSAPRRGAPVDLAVCDGGDAQRWRPGPGGELRNVRVGQCLTDPGANPAVGTALAVSACSGARSQVWWLP